MKKVLIVFGFVCLVLLAGCGQEPGYGVEISLSDRLTTDGEGFRYDGEVSEVGTRGGKEVYRDVVVCLYSSEKRLLDRSTPKDLVPPNEINVTVSSTSIPVYVVINSTDFWDSDAEIDVSYYELVGEGRDAKFRGSFAQKPSDLPVRSCTAE